MKEHIEKVHSLYVYTKLIIIVIILRLFMFYHQYLPLLRCAAYGGERH